MRKPLLLALLALAPFVALACDGDNPGGAEDETLPPVLPGDDTADASTAPPDAPSTPDAPLSAEAEAAAPPTIPPIDPTIPASPAATCSDGSAPTAYVLAQNGTLFDLDPGTLAMRALGIPACAPNASAFTVSASGAAYVLSDALYKVDLTTLACTRTSYASSPIGNTAITLGAGTSSDRLWSYGSQPAPSIGVSDLTTLVRFPTGAVPAGLAMGSVDLTMDAFGRLFALAIDGTLLQLDPATGAVLGQDHTGFDGANGAVLVSGTMALMAYQGQLYFFSGPSGALSRYDTSTKQLQPLGPLDQAIVGASAAACVASAGISDAGVEAGLAEAGAGAGVPVTPFTAGDAWIGTYTCQQGLTDLAVVIDAVQGNAIQARFDFLGAAGDGGSFVLSGTYDPDTREASFSPGAWVSQPDSNTIPVGLDGYVDLGGRQLSGSVTYDGCGSFLVQR